MSFDSNLHSWCMSGVTRLRSRFPVTFSAFMMLKLWALILLFLFFQKFFNGVFYNFSFFSQNFDINGCFLF